MMPFLSNTVPVVIHADGTYEVTDDLCFTHEKSGKRHTVQRGFLTDMASVPRFLSWLTPIAGAHNQAAILHDRNCVEQANAYRAGRAPDITSVETDGLFLDNLLELGVPRFRARAYWVGVRFGAAKNRARRADWWDTFPELLLWTLLLLPVVPAGLLTWLTLAAGQAVAAVADVCRFFFTNRLPPDPVIDNTRAQLIFDARRSP